MDIVTADQTPSHGALYRLLSWLSPAFPIGAYSYSHGLEHAVETGLVGDRDQLREWVATIITRGSGRNDGLILAAAYRSVDRQDADALLRVAELAWACRPTAELALETTAQGRAFQDAVRVGWPAAELDELRIRLVDGGLELTYPVSVGVVAADHGVPLAATLSIYLQAFAANLVSAGVRLVPLGQSDGVRVCAALESAVLETTRVCLDGDLQELGTATPMVDWASASHETQYTRIFRS